MNLSSHYWISTSYFAEQFSVNNEMALKGLEVKHSHKKSGHVFFCTVLESKVDRKSQHTEYFSNLDDFIDGLTRERMELDINVS